MQRDIVRSAFGWEESEDLMVIRMMFEENADQYRVYIEGL
jgi:hypothetical protein